MFSYWVFSGDTILELLIQKLTNYDLNSCDAINENVKSIFYNKLFNDIKFYGFYSRVHKVAALGADIAQVTAISSFVVLILKSDIDLLLVEQEPMICVFRDKLLMQLFGTGLLWLNMC